MTMENFLGQLGCKDIAMTKARFLEDSAFYFETTAEMLADPCFELLGRELESENCKEAFNTAHTLKGIIANCGLTPLYELVVQLVEPLRAGTADFAALRPIYRLLLEKRAAIIAALPPAETQG